MKIKFLTNPIVIVLLIFLGCQKEHHKNKIVAVAGLIEAADTEGTIPQVKTTVKKVDIEKSITHWRGTKMFRAKKHEGTLKLKAGELFFHDDKLVGGYIVSDMRSIQVTDMPAHETIHITNLTNHLNSDFDTNSYPTSKFVIIYVEYLTKTSLKITGKMTIRNVTKELTVSAKAYNSTQMKFECTFSINRIDWNIGIDGSWLERQLVDDEIDLQVRIVTF